MKIALIMLTDKGGMVHYASQLANALSNYHEVFPIISKNTEKKYFNDSIKIEFITKPSSFASIQILNFYQIIKNINKIQPDIIHILAPHPLICLALPFLRRYRIIVTIHDPILHLGDVSLERTVSYKLTLKFVDRIIVHGQILKNELIKKENIDESKIFIIPHGDYSFFTQFKKENLKEDNSILFFGRIREYKGLRYLIKAAPEIIKEFPGIKIVIAGEGEIKEYTSLREFQENKNNFEVYNDYISDEKVAELFQRAKIVILPYIEGSQSGVLQIAFAFGKPIITTSVGSISEIVQDGINGVIIPPKNTEQLAFAVVKLLKDSVVYNELTKNINNLRMKFDWNLLYKKYYNPLYSSIVDNLRNI